MSSRDLVLWELIRATGLIAYVLLSLAVLLGVGVRVRAFDWLAKRAWVFELHQAVSVLALAFTALHAVLLLGNSHVPFGLTEILVPFTSSWRRVAIAAGTLAFYLLAILIGTSYTRGRIGERAWRTIHFGGFAAWGFALFHGVLAGHDSSVPWVQYVYVGTGGSVALLTVFRILEATVVRTARDPRTAARQSGTIRPAAPTGHATKAAPQRSASRPG
jgi:sulfoxide reductase heme-binding subunit YedZ